MSYSLLAGAIWVLLGTFTALLPMRRQYPLGVSLLVLAPFLIFWIGHDHGWVIGVLALAAFLSMFRRPLLYFYARARGKKPEVTR